MKREDLPGFVRELPITILTILILAVILATVFSPLYRHYRKKAEEAQALEAQENVLVQESTETAPGSADEPDRSSD